MVEMYSSDGSIWCRRAKMYLTKRGVKFRSIDINERRNAEKLYRLTRQHGIPVTLIGTDIVIGFDREKLDRAILSAEKNSLS